MSDLNKTSTMTTAEKRQQTRAETKRQMADSHLRFVQKKQAFLDLAAGKTTFDQLRESQVWIDNPFDHMIFATLAGAIIFLIFNKEKPPTPPCPAGHDERIAVFAGLKHIFKQKDMIYLIIFFFVALGIFNAVTTWIEQIISPRGFTIEQAGIAGALMMIGGIVGASIIPVLSDKMRRRKIFIVIACIGAIPGLAGMTFAGHYGLLLASCIVFGFFLMAGGPVCFQYSAEVSYPAPEATSQGLLMLAGQISGIIFIFGMDILTAAGASKTPAMLIFIALMIINVFLILNVKESKMVKTDEI